MWSLCGFSPGTPAFVHRYERVFVYTCSVNSWQPVQGLPLFSRLAWSRICSISRTTQIWMSAIEREWMARNKKGKWKEQVEMESVGKARGSRLRRERTIHMQKMSRRWANREGKGIMSGKGGKRGEMEWEKVKRPAAVTAQMERMEDVWSRLLCDGACLLHCQTSFCLLSFSLCALCAALYSPIRLCVADKRSQRGEKSKFRVQTVNPFIDRTSLPERYCNPVNN